jgi:signal transduction histidine kinase
VYAAACAVIIFLFANFRKQDFKQRLEEKAITTIRLLSDVKQFDEQLLKIIDSNSINKLYDEKTLVFNEKKELVYSSLDDKKVNWTLNDLNILSSHQNLFKEDEMNEIYGTSSLINGRRFYVVISANDNYGKRKLEYLIYILVLSYIGFTILTWSLCYLAVKKLFKPLDVFYESLAKINANNLHSRLEYSESNKNEISLIAKEFNMLLERVEFAYQKQKEFTSQASHELRTPLARISAQLENYLLHPEDITKLRVVLKNTHQLSELVDSLLLLSRLDYIEQVQKEKIRIDEVLYKCMDKAHQEFKDLKISFDIQEQDITEKMMTVNCNASLLQIVFSNLIKNAYTYSDNQSVSIRMYFEEDNVLLEFKNTGNSLSPQEELQLYQPFMRGQNAKHTSGIGLGLRMVHRILHFYGFSIHYRSDSNLNMFIIRFSHI